MNTEKQNNQIQKTNFNEQMLELKNFSNEIPTTSDLPSFEELSFWGIFEYDAKGKDLNKLATAVSSHIESIQKVQIKTIKEFNEIYKTFTALDTQYIKYFVNIIESIKDDQKKINKLSSNNEQIIIKLSESIKILTNFKNQIDNIKKLNHIDEIFDRYENLSVIYKDLSININSIESNLLSLTNQLKTENIEIKDKVLELSVNHTQLNEKICKINKESATQFELLNKKFSVLETKRKTDYELLSLQLNEDYSSISEKIEEIKMDFIAKHKEFNNSIDNRFTEINNEFQDKFIIMDSKIKDSFSSIMDKNRILNEKITIELDSLKNTNIELKKYIYFYRNIFIASLIIIIVLIFTI